MQVDPETVRDISIALTTVYPVIAVAFFAARSTPDDLLAKVSNGLTIRVEDRWTRGWRRRAAGVARMPIQPGARAYQVDPRFWLGADQRFVTVFPIGFLLALSSLALSESHRASRLLLGVSIVLLQWLINSLLLFTTQTAAYKVALSDVHNETACTSFAMLRFGIASTGIALILVIALAIEVGIS